MSLFKTEPLIGKPFVMGTQDCFTLVRDFYELNFGIEMPNFARPNDWVADKDDLIQKYYPHAGFNKLDIDEHWPPKPADLLVCTLGGSVPNHLVVVLDGNEVLHHLTGQLSAKEVLRPAWRRYAAYSLRHPDVPQVTPKVKSIELLELYRENSI